MAKLTIDIPEGYSGIDTEKSDFEKGIIIFKKKEKVSWKDDDPEVSGFYVATDNKLLKQSSPIKWAEHNRNIFATKKQARSMQAMAQLSQIMANDERFGLITDEEWADNEVEKYVIEMSDSNHRLKPLKTR